MSVLISFLVDEAYMAQSDAETLAKVGCCAWVVLRTMVGLHCQVLAANNVTNLQQLAAMSSHNLTTVKWETVSDQVMVARVYVPFLRTAIEKADKLNQRTATSAGKEASRNNHAKRSRSAESRKEEKRAEKKRRRAEENETKTGRGEVNLAAVLENLGVAIKPKIQMLSINTGDKMKSLGLDESFDLDQCPPQMAVRKLLTKATEQQKALGMKGVPFVNMNLKEFLPGWCAEASPVLEGHGIGDSRNNSKGELDPVTWRLAWRRFALAAAMVGTMPFDAAKLHINEVDKLTLEGRTMGGRRVNLGIIYDEVCRRKWSEYSQALRDEFCVADAVLNPIERANMREYGYIFYIGPVVLHAYPRVCNREAVRALNLAAPKHSDRQVNDQARNANWGAGYDRNKGWSDKNWERKQVCCFGISVGASVGMVWPLSFAGV